MTGGQARRHLPPSPAERRRTRTHRVLWAASWGPALVLATVAGTRAIGEDGTIAFIAGHALLPWLLLGAWPMAVAAVLTRRWLLAAVSAAVVVAHVVWSVPLFAPAPPRSPTAAGSGTIVRLVTVNLYALNTRIPELAEALAQADADVMLLQEVTPANHALLARIGALDGYRHAVADPQVNSSGSAIYSRLPLTGPAVIRLADATMTTAGLVAGTGTATILNVQTTSPLTRATAWNAELAEVARFAARAPRPLIVGGDFNATRDHRPFRRILGTGLVDVHRHLGREEAVTWPAGRRLVPPLVRLDHVLVSDGIRPQAVRELPAIGSDHRPVVVDVVVE